MMGWGSRPTAERHWSLTFRSISQTTQAAAKVRRSRICSTCRISFTTYSSYTDLTKQPGNFQDTNFSGLGFDGDAIRADAQDSFDTNNAAFFATPDGIAPRMQMGEWRGATSLIVSNPDELAGELDASSAIFGPPLENDGTSGAVVITNPVDGCSALSNSLEIAGNIALIERGEWLLYRESSLCTTSRSNRGHHHQQRTGRVGNDGWRRTRRRTRDTIVDDYTRQRRPVTLGNWIGPSRGRNLDRQSEPRQQSGQRCHYPRVRTRRLNSIGRWTVQCVLARRHSEWRVG